MTGQLRTHSNGLALQPRLHPEDMCVCGGGGEMWCGVMWRHCLTLIHPPFYPFFNTKCFALPSSSFYHLRYSIVIVAVYRTQFNRRYVRSGQKCITPCTDT
jgi:hypothetical protein